MAHSRDIINEAQLLVRKNQYTEALKLLNDNIIPRTKKTIPALGVYAEANIGLLRNCEESAPLAKTYLRDALKYANRIIRYSEERENRYGDESINFRANASAIKVFTRAAGYYRVQSLKAPLNEKEKYVELHKKIASQTFDLINKLEPKLLEKLENLQAELSSCRDEEREHKLNKLIKESEHNYLSINTSKVELALYTGSYPYALVALKERRDHFSNYNKEFFGKEGFDKFYFLSRNKADFLLEKRSGISEGMFEKLIDQLKGVAAMYNVPVPQGLIDAMANHRKPSNLNKPDSTIQQSKPRYPGINPDNIILHD